MKNWKIVLVLLFFGFITFYPIIFSLITSFKSNTQFYNEFWFPTFPLQLSNYTLAFDLVIHFILNTFVYSIITIFFVCILTSVSGYIFARYDFYFKNLIFMIFISLIMVPGILTLAPRFVLFRDLNLLNNPLALILTWVASGLIVGTWLMRNYFEALPKELFDAAYVDGANEIQIFLTVAIPLSKPIFATVIITNLLGCWNDLIWPLVAISSKKYMTLAQGLLTFSAAFETEWGPLFSGYVISALPLLIVFIFALKQFVSGITQGAVKG